MVKFVGVKEAGPLAICKQGANQRAHVLMTKTRKQSAGAKTAPAPLINVPENTDMDFKTQKALLALEGVTKAYAVAITDEAAFTAFLGKTAAEQTAEAEAAKAKTDEAEAARLALETGKSAKEIALEKTLADNAAEIAALKKKDTDRDEAVAIEKRARDDFSGYPGGVEAAVKMLTAAKTLDADARKTIEDGMTAQIAVAKRFTEVTGKNAVDSVKAAPANAKIDAEVEKRVAETKKSKGEVYADLAQDPAWSQTFSDAREEERSAA